VTPSASHFFCLELSLPRNEATLKILTLKVCVVNANQSDMLIYPPPRCPKLQSYQHPTPLTLWRYRSLIIIIIIILNPGTQFPGWIKKISIQKIKLEWFLIRLVLNRKTAMQQDRVEALHDNRSTLEKIISPLGRRQRAPRFADQGHIATAVPLR